MSSRGVVADAQLERAVAARHVLRGLVGQRLLRLVAQRDPAGIGRQAPAAAAQQGVQRHVGGLAADVPQGHVDAGERQRGAAAHAVAGQLHAVHALPRAHHVGGFHAHQQGREGVLDQAGDRAWAAARMGLAVAGEAFRGLHAHDHRVPLERAADAHGHRPALGQAVGDRNGRDGGDLHGTASCGPGRGRAKRVYPPEAEPAS
jgi:hypothetical protein